MADYATYKRPPSKVAKVEIMLAAQTVFGSRFEELSAKEKQQVEKTFRRIEKLLGYEVGSWARTI